MPAKKSRLVHPAEEVEEKKAWKKLVRRKKSPSPSAWTSQGRGKPLSKYLVLEKLKPYFQCELDIKRTCDAFNTKARDEFYSSLARGLTKREKPEYIARSTVQTWYEQDDDVRHLIDSWKDTINIMARQKWRERIQMGDYQASKDWLERRERDQFALKETQTIQIANQNVLVQLPPIPLPDTSSNS